MTDEQPQPEIYVSKKPLKKYVKALKYRLNELETAKSVARGNNIRKAVDAAEIVKNENENVSVTDVATNTQTSENDDGSTYSVSGIEITLEGSVDLEDNSEKEEE